MSLVMTTIKLSNSLDLSNAKRGLITPDSVRSVEIEALIDTGAFGLCIPEEAADLLGVEVFTHRPARTADGRTIEVPVVGPIELEVLGRSMTGDAMVLPHGTQALVGAIPLEYLDLVVVPRTGEVIGNPAHPDGPVYRI
jgi:clan AA aspartic protease